MMDNGLLRFADEPVLRFVKVHSEVKRAATSASWLAGLAWIPNVKGHRKVNSE